jgi:hypothetical protein
MHMTGLLCFAEEILKNCPEVFEHSVIAHLEAGDIFLWDDRSLHCNGEQTWLTRTETSA